MIYARFKLIRFFADIALDGQKMSDLFTIVAYRNDFPLHHKFGSIPAIIDGFAVKQLAGFNVVIELLYDLFI